MTFLNPAFLLALPLIAVPVIIHLFNKRRQKRIAWGAMRFLVHAATKRRQVWRLTDILLLLLRTLAFAALIFAMSRPLAPALWPGSAQAGDVIVVLDQSMSMSRRVGGVSLFELQVREATRLLESLSASDSVRLLQAGPETEWLTPQPQPATAANVSALRARLSGLKPSLGGADINMALRMAIDAEPSPKHTTRSVVLFSDTQRVGWRLDEQQAWSTLSAALQSSKTPTTVHLRLIASPTSTVNLAANEIACSRPFSAAHQPLTFTASIQNHGMGVTPKTLATWRLGAHVVASSTVSELEPGAATTLTLSHSFDNPGTHILTCELDGADELPQDNQAHLAVEICERLPIALIEDPDAAKGPEGNSFYLLAALGGKSPSAEAASKRTVFDPVILSPHSLAAADLARLRCVVLSDVSRLSPSAVAQLEGFAQSGGGLWISAGPNTEASTFNEHLYAGGFGLAPLKLMAPIETPDEHVSSTRVFASGAHPATMLLADSDRLDLDQARLRQRHRFELPPGGDAPVLLRTEQGDPFAVERAFGRGRVIALGAPLGVSWSTLPLCQAYVTMVHEWLWYLIEPALTRRNLNPGEELLFSATNRQANASLLLPDGRRVAVASETTDGRSQFRYASTRVPGIYTLAPEQPGASHADEVFFVKRPPRESNLESLSEQDQRFVAGMPGFFLEPPHAGLRAHSGAQPPRKPIEQLLLLGVLLLIVVERECAAYSARRNARVQGVSMR